VSSTNVTGQPDIFEYLDYRSYLRDWFEHRKRTWPEFSYEYFMRKAGLGSKATLHNVISGRRNPREGTLSAFAKGMELDDAESAYLEKLVELALCKTLEKRREVLLTMIEDPLFQKDRRLKGELSEAEMRFMSRWYCWAIWELARAPGFRADPVWLSKTLVPSITEVQAAEALELLFVLKFLELGEDGRVSTSEIRISTNDVVTQRDAARALYRSNLDNAYDSLLKVPHQERFHRSATLLIPDALFPELKAKLSNVLREIMRDSDEAMRDKLRVYQIGVQLFPMSTHVESEAADSADPTDEDG